MVKKMDQKDERLSIIRSLAKENAADILVSIIEHNARSPTQLSAELSLQPNQVHRVLDELKRENLITKEEESQTPLRPWVFYRPTAKGKEAARLLK
jgi:DNA-binding MarR family transcriptional regulator